jgi:predicted transcriptional regulator YheO
MQTYHNIAEAISLLLYPHAEVIIHDLKSGLISAIFNPFSKRKKGDESLLDPVKRYPDIFPPYNKMNWDGKLLRSVSITLRNNQNTPIALMCINVDLSKWNDLYQYLEKMIKVENAPNEILFKDDWRERINVFVTDYIKENNLNLKTLSREEKQTLVVALHKKGAFNAKNAANYVADVLDLSRATIYNYLRN